MDEKSAYALMNSSKTKREWRMNADIVAQAHGGKYPSYWWKLLCNVKWGNNYEYENPDDDDGVNNDDDDNDTDYQEQEEQEDIIEDCWQRQLERAEEPRTGEEYEDDDNHKEALVMIPPTILARGPKRGFFDQNGDLVV